MQLLVIYARGVNAKLFVCAILFEMFNLVACCIVAISVASAVGSPIPAGSGIYQNFFQGDIKLSDRQKAMLSAPKNDSSRTGWTHPTFWWPKNALGHVVVPFNIAPSQGFSK